MANSVTHDTQSRTIDIVFDGDTDYDYGEMIRVESMEFIPSAANDWVKVRTGTTAAVATTASAVLFHVKSAADTDPKTKSWNPPKLCRPFVDSEDLATSGGCRLIINYV